MNKQVLYLAASTFLGLLFSFLFSEPVLLQIIIIFGQAHFIVAYFYKNKSGKLDKKYINNFLYFLVLLFIPTYFIGLNIVYVNYFIVFTTLIFVLHYFYDELKIFNFQDDNFKNIAALAVFLSFTTIFTMMVFELKSILYLTPVIFLIILLFGMLNFKLIKRDFDFSKLENLSIYLFTALNIFVPLLLLFTDIGVLKITGFIIIFHYLRWYFFYFDRFNSLEDKKELNFYLDVVFWVHIFVIILFVIYSIDAKRGFLFLLFGPIFFYTWTLLHIVLSIRKDDYPLIFGKN